MAEDRVTVPIELTVTDIRTEDVDLKDLEKSMKEKLSSIAKSASDVLGRVDTSKLNKALTTAMDKVTSSYQKLAADKSKFDEALISAGSSSPKYKEELKKIQGQIDSQSKLYEELLDHFESSAVWKSANAKLDRGETNLSQSEANSMQSYLQALTDRDNTLDGLKAQMPNPKDFIDSATSTELQKIINLYYTMFNTVNKVESATRSWNEVVANNQMTDEFTKNLKDLETYEKKLETIKAKSKKMSELGATSQSWKSLQYDADLLEEKIQQIIERLKVMVTTGNAFRFEGGDTTGQLEALEERLQNVTLSMREVRDTPQTVNNSIIGLTRVINSFCVSAKKGLANVISMFKNLGKASHTTSKNMSKSMKKIWRNILMLGFGVRSTFFLVRRLRNIFIESFKEMATQIPEVNKSISTFVTSTNQLKGSVATAFQPIVTAVIPWLNQLIATLNTAMNALGRFFATLTGQGYIYKFTAAQVDYAESLDKTGSAAKKAQKSLMGFDEINRLNADDASGGGSGDVPTGTWEKEMLNGMSSLAELIKEAWSDGDFTEVGQYIGEKLLGALRVADEWVLTKGYEVADKIGNSLATLLNGVIETKGLGTQIGKTIADGINMGMIGINKFFSTSNWTSLGKFIADWANASVLNFNWTLLGQTVASVITGAVNTWWKFAGDFDFSTLGSSISTAINNIFSNLLSNDSASKLGQAISNTVRGILQTLTKAINNTDWSAVGKTIGEVLGNIDWSGIIIDFAKLVGAFVKALAEAFINWTATDPLSAGIATMLVLAIGAIDLGAKVTGLILKFAPIIKDADTLGKAFKAVIDVIKEWAPTFGGIITIVTGAITFFSNFFDMLVNGFSWVNEALMIVGAALVAVGAIILGAPAFVTAVIAAIVATIATIVVVVKDNWNEIVAFVKAIPGWFMDNIVTPVATFFSNLGTNIVNFFKNALLGIQNTWTVIVSWFTNTIINPISTGFSNAVTNIKGFFSNCVSNIKSAWGGVTSWFSSIGNGIKTAFNNAVSGIKSAFSGAFTSIKNGCKAAFNTVISFVERGINSLIIGVNKVISGINKLAGGAAKLAGVKFSGISTIPTVSLPRLAQGGVIPPNREFMAILGDQKHGTNIEAPLDTIKQAVAEELAEYIDAMMVGFRAVVDAVESKDLSVRIGDKEIGKAAERYNMRQALIRGV